MSVLKIRTAAVTATADHARTHGG